MKTLLRWATRLYPAGWRRRYGTEFDALIEDLNPTWGGLLDILKGGLQMQMKRSALTVAGFAVIGVLIGGAISFALPRQFASRGMMRIEATNSIPEDAVQKAAITGFSRDNLAAIITRQHLYDNERARGSMDAVVERFRGDINVRLVSNRVFQISYLDSDRARSQAVTQDLMTQLAETAAVEVIDPPDLPQRAVRSNRVSLVGLGLTSGTLIGAFVVLIRRRRPVAI